MSKNKLLIPSPFPSSGQRLNAYEVFGLDALTYDAADLGKIRAIAVAGHRKFGPDDFAKMPKLEIVAKFGVGYDSIDVTAATEAGIIVTNTPDVLTDEVADLTVGLLIATVREIPKAERYLRAGKWDATQFPFTASLRDKKIGIVGHGRIGAAIARRIKAMDLPVSYFGRHKQANVELPYFDSISALAEAVDVLILTVPGGSETENLVDAQVLSLLGSSGVIINVARGPVVNEDALIDALKNNVIAAAGLDVFEHEPQVPQALLEMDNVVLLPHVGSATTTTRESMGDLVFANLDNWFAGKGPITPVN